MRKRERAREKDTGKFLERRTSERERESARKRESERERECERERESEKEREREQEREIQADELVLGKAGSLFSILSYVVIICSSLHVLETGSWTSK